jgi:O-antigen/teichoic acid export membrane protein
MDLDARLLPGKPPMRSVARRIRLNSIWLLLARLTMQVQLVVFTVLVARYLGVAGFGQYAFVAALIYLGNVATTFGTDTLLIREVARRQPADDALVTAALWLQLTLSVAWLIVVAIGTGVLSSQSTEVFAALKVYSLSLIPLAFYTVFTAVLRAHERMGLYLLLNVAVAFIRLGGAWWNPAIASLVIMLMCALPLQSSQACCATVACRLFD